jgi:hypothetical protein
MWDGDGGAAAWLGDVVRSSACAQITLSACQTTSGVGDVEQAWTRVDNQVTQRSHTLLLSCNCCRWVC